MMKSLIFLFLIGFSDLIITQSGIHARQINVNENSQVSITHQKEDFPPVLNQTEGCGGTLVAQSGYIAYKMNDTYNNNERCVWTIRTDKVATMIHVRSQGFDTVDDYLSIYALDSSGVLKLLGKINKDSGNRIFEFVAPLIFLTFTSNHYGVGNGFSLEYFGFAYKQNTGYVFENLQLKGTSGRIEHPSPEYLKNEFATYSITPVPNKLIKINVDHVDMGKLDAGCPFNYFSVHQMFSSTFDLRLRFCEPETRNTAIISSSSPILITFFATTSPLQTGFSFSWSIE